MTWRVCSDRPGLVKTHFVNGIGCFISCVALLTPVACGPGIWIRPTKPALALPTGKPQSACEISGFLELTPSTAIAAESVHQNVSASTSVVTTVKSQTSGLAVYHRGQPLELATILPQIDEPRLTELHFARTQPLRQRSRYRKYLNIASLITGVIAVGGIALAASDKTGGITDGSSAVPFFTGVTSGVLSVGSALGALALGLTADEKIYLKSREHLFIEDEDDLEAATRGINRYNESIRARCK